jgi:hypothetical protein
LFFSCCKNDVIRERIGGVIDKRVKFISAFFNAIDFNIEISLWFRQRSWIKRISYAPRNGTEQRRLLYPIPKQLHEMIGTSSTCAYYTCFQVEWFLARLLPLIMKAFLPVYYSCVSGYTIDATTCFKVATIHLEQTVKSILNTTAKLVTFRHWSLLSNKFYLIICT